MSILDIIKAHEPRILGFKCACGAEFNPPNPQGRPALRHRAHVAQVLEQHTRDKEAKAWQEGVGTALNHAILNPDGITLRLEHLDGRPWVNPYHKETRAE